MLTKIPEGYKEAVIDRKEIKSKGLASAVGQDAGLNRNSVILNLDDQESGKKQKAKKPSQMKSSYALTASSPDGSKRSPRFEQIKNNEALLKNR